MEEKLYFKNSNGLNLCGILSNPSSDSKKTIIILCHGFGSSKNSRTYVELQRRLNKFQLSTFRFDFFGHGESEGKFKDITISEAIDDILCAIKLLKSKSYSELGLIGSSFGGIASIITASKVNDLFVLALKSPVSNFEDKFLATTSKEAMDKWKKKGYHYYVRSDGERKKINYTFFEDCKNNDGYDAAKKIKIPTLIVHGDNDESVPISQSKKTATLIQRCTLKIIRGADHQYSKPEDFEKMIELISKFIVKICSSS